ncbi:MAG: DEAD/DEAH box helicase family protein, partial [Pseudomonadota bacterium]
MSHLNEVINPIINDAYEEPKHYYLIEKGETPKLIEGRREAFYYYRPPGRQTSNEEADDIGTKFPLELVNEIRKRLKDWREDGYRGITSVTDELLKYWNREEREKRLFFCQQEAAETIIFLSEARADYRQGITIPRDEPSREANEKGYTGFLRYACKMATGTGKTTVMGMLAAWSILNKVANRSDARFSDTVLVICPNITIRERLQELDPNKGEASLYRTFDLVPPHLMSDLRKGQVIITNWHVLEPQEMNTVGKDSSRVVRRGVERKIKVTRDIDGKKVEAIETRYYESDTAVVEKVLRSVKGKNNILVFNDEAHHAYRIRQLNNTPELEEEDELSEVEEKEATVWIEGLDKANRIRGINFCVDLSATPFYLSNTGNEPGRPFPWVVSDFGLIDAIESGLVKIPQLPIEDTTGRPIPAYFNVWKWIIEEKLTRTEKGGRRGQIKPEAILKWAQLPIAQLAGLWRETFLEWKNDAEKGLRPSVPPVFIIVCRDTKLARVIYDWIAEGKSETAPPIEEFRNRNGEEYTVRIDSKVIEELETGAIKTDENSRLRFILDTIGKTVWPGGKPPEGYLALVEKLNRKAMEEGGKVADPFIPPGRDIRCIISVAMLTEGWDAKTVTHIVGLRPFQSQLLCEQVVGRALRRSQYHDLQVEEVAKVYGVPFELIPLKTNPKGPKPPPPKIHHVFAISPEKDHLEIRFPRVEGYAFKVENKIQVDWLRVPTLHLDPGNIPDEVRVKGLSATEGGRLSLLGPGRADDISLAEWRKTKRFQELEFEVARTLTTKLESSTGCEIPVHRLFSQILQIVKQFVKIRVQPMGGTDVRDLFLNPYYGWAVETLMGAIIPNVMEGEGPELPRYETNRDPGSTHDVDFWTSKKVVECQRSHLNYAVADTQKWEQMTKFYLDKHDNVISFVRNFNLGFA